MTYEELIELDNDAEIIDLGVASLETEGTSSGDYPDGATSADSYTTTD